MPVLFSLSLMLAHVLPFIKGIAFVFFLLFVSLLVLSSLSVSSSCYSFETCTAVYAFTTCCCCCTGCLVFPHIRKQQFSPRTNIPVWIGDTYGYSGKRRREEFIGFGRM